jgi:hypothetical protein
MRTTTTTNALRTHQRPEALRQHERRVGLSFRTCPICYDELFIACGRLGCVTCGFATGEHVRAADRFFRARQ